MRTVRFAGYAAVFDRVDRGGDVVRQGAFAESLKARGARGVRLLLSHAPDQPVGVIEHLSEDRRGLRVIGRIEGRGGAAKRAAEMVAKGGMDGLSFGYRVVEAAGAGPRELKALDLVEVSLVAFPMQPLARVHAVEG